MTTPVPLTHARAVLLPVPTVRLGGGSGLARIRDLRAVAGILALAAAAACGGRQDAAPEPAPEPAAVPEPGATIPGAISPASPPETAAGEGQRSTGVFTALSESRKLQIRTALSNLNRSLLNFHVINGRYPADEAELRASPETAGELAIVEDLARSVSYRLEGGTYTVAMALPDGPPLTMSGSDPTLEAQPPAAPGARGRPVE